MRIIALLLVVAFIYMLVRVAAPTLPLDPVQSMQPPRSGEPAPPSNAFKQPLDAARQALDANKKRTSEEF